MLLSAGGFAVYRAETHVFNLLAPRFGNLRTVRDRERLLEVWLRSKMFARSGLNAGHIRDRVLRDCRNSGDFLRTMMSAIADQQGVPRWAETTPEHLLYLAQIKRAIPDALVLHIVRDGRDVALSMARQGWIRPFPWDRGRDSLVAGLYWEWIVRKGRETSKLWAHDYLEVSYEELLAAPQKTLDRVGRHIGQRLDYEQILRVGIGSVSQPNSSFSAAGGSFVGRWKNHFSEHDLSLLEDMIGPALQTFGYALADPGRRRTLRGRILRASYRSFFEGKFQLKHRTPLGKSMTTLTLFQPEDCTPEPGKCYDETQDLAP